MFNPKIITFTHHLDRTAWAVRQHSSQVSQQWHFKSVNNGIRSAPALHPSGSPLPRVSSPQRQSISSTYGISVAPNECRPHRSTAKKKKKKNFHHSKYKIPRFWYRIPRFKRKFHHFYSPRSSRSRTATHPSYESDSSQVAPQPQPQPHPQGDHQTIPSGRPVHTALPPQRATSSHAISVRKVPGIKSCVRLLVILTWRSSGVSFFRR